MDDMELSAEEIIFGMRPDEICELLQEMGVETDESDAAAIQRLIGQLGSLEAALEALEGEGGSVDKAA